MARDPADMLLCTLGGMLYPPMFDFLTTSVLLNLQTFKDCSVNKTEMEFY